jgi:guanylate kinase
VQYHFLTTSPSRPSPPDSDLRSLRCRQEHHSQAFVCTISRQIWLLSLTYTLLCHFHPYSNSPHQLDTTRSPRPGEEDGKDYNFVTKEAFQKLIDSNGFTEHAQFGSNSYGTSVAAIESIAKQNRICVLDIEMEGVKQIRAHPKFGKTARFLFLSPPSPEVLEKRLRGRQTDSEEAIQKRLEAAKREMEFAKVEGVHDKVVVNDDLEKAYEEVRKWVVDEA